MKTQIVKKLVVEIIHQSPEYEHMTLEQEAENIRDSLLDACGFYPKVDYKVTVKSVELLPSSELWEIDHEI